MSQCVTAFLVMLGLLQILVAQTPVKLSSASASKAKQKRSVNTSAGKTQKAYAIDAINDVLWWLPEDTETIEVARGPFKIVQAVEPTSDMTGLEVATLGLRSLPLALLHSIKKGIFNKHLEGNRVLFSVEGSRRFSEPTGLGGMIYEGCSITILEQNLTRGGNALLSQMSSKAKQVQRVAGHQVMVFEQKMEDDLWTILIAVPAPNVVLCATNQDYLTLVLNRMRQKGQRRALPDTLPEWKQVNTEASFWAVRHYDPSNAERDSTSPLSGLEKAANWPDNQAVGIVFELDPDKSKTANVRYLSANRNAFKIFSDEQKKASTPGQDFKPMIREKEPGVVEMQVSLDKQEQAGMFLLVLLALLGHAIYT